MSSLVPTDYAATLESIKRLVHEAHYIAQRRVNTNCSGSPFIERQKTAPWGSKVLSQLSPAHSENINFFGAIEADIDAELAQLGPTGYRPLRVRDTLF